MAASGFGVAATFWRGVTPEKSEACSSGFSPPAKGVWPACRRARFWASIVMRSMPLAAIMRGVRMGVANLRAWPSSRHVCQW